MPSRCIQMKQNIEYTWTRSLDEFFHQILKFLEDSVDVFYGTKALKSI